MKKVFSVSFLLFILIACSTSEKNADIPKFIQVQSKGLSTSKVEVKVEGSTVHSNIFDYGSEIEFVLKDIEGLTESNGKRYPGMSLTVMNTEKDTLFFLEDMYADLNGTNKFPLTMFAKLIAANPIHSNTPLLGKIHVWDKKGTGTMDLDFSFTTKPNATIQAKAKKLTYKELYLFSTKENKVIPRKTFPIDDNVMFIIEGLEGFKVENDRIYPALQIQVKNENNQVVLDEENLFKGYAADGVDPADLKERIYFNINTVGTSYKELKVHAVLVDLKSEAALVIDAELFKAEK